MPRSLWKSLLNAFCFAVSSTLRWLPQSLFHFPVSRVILSSTAAAIVNIREMLDVAASLSRSWKIFHYCLLPPSVLTEHSSFECLHDIRSFSLLLLRLVFYLHFPMTTTTTLFPSLVSSSSSFSCRFWDVLKVCFIQANLWGRKWWKRTTMRRRIWFSSNQFAPFMMLFGSEFFT